MKKGATEYMFSVLGKPILILRIGDCGLRNLNSALHTPAIEDLFCGRLREIRIDLLELIHLLFGSLHPFDVFSKPLFTGGNDIPVGLGNWGIGKLGNWEIGELGDGSFYIYEGAEAAVLAEVA